MRKKKIVPLFDVSICSNNLGDQIISHYVRRELDAYFNHKQVVSIPSHDYLGIHAYKALWQSTHSLVGGSNLLSSNMPFYRQWKIRLGDPLVLKNVILFGAGWWQYQNQPNIFTRYALRQILSSDRVHSVRDRYTEKMLKRIGIENVLNTGCPTMWGLTEEHCQRVPTKKGRAVITTITDYNFDLARDTAMLKTLLATYEKVYIWLQGERDLAMLQQTGLQASVEAIPPSLSRYTAILSDQSIELDYVGTRLHAGIHALNHRRRSLIISIDNRAKEISADSGLPIIERTDIPELLYTVNKEWDTPIKIKVAEIARFREQLGELDRA